jgi:hypothetical protein
MKRRGLPPMNKTTIITNDMANFEPLVLQSHYIARPLVYFLIDKQSIVYVGSSKFGFSRICTHYRNKVFNAYNTYYCDEHELENLEAYYITKFTPKYNKSIPKNDIFISQCMAKSHYGMFAKTFKEMTIEQTPSVVYGTAYYIITDEMREAGIK